jgi:hypothetical protein
MEVYIYSVEYIGYPLVFTDTKYLFEGKKSSNLSPLSLKRFHCFLHISNKIQEAIQIFHSTQVIFLI